MKNTQDIKELILIENQELYKENEAQSEEILKLKARLSEFEGHGQQIEDIGESVARVSNDIDDIEESITNFYENIKDMDDKIKTIPHKKNNTISHLLIGGAGLAIIVALGLSLDFKIGDSKITYNGDGIVRVLIQSAGLALGGGVLSQKIKPIKKMLNNISSNDY